MVDVAFQHSRLEGARRAGKHSSLHNALKRKSTVAFLMTLPLILLISILVSYPAL
jgi:multiple sugar transport system permease protein